MASDALNIAGIAPLRLDSIGPARVALGQIPVNVVVLGPFDRAALGLLQQVDTAQLAALVGLAQRAICRIHAPPICGIGLPYLGRLGNMESTRMVALKGRHVGQRQKHLVVAGNIVVPAQVATGRGNTTRLVNAIGTLRQRGEQVAQNGLVNAREYIQAQQIVGRQSTKHMAQAARVLDQLANLAQVIRRRSIARPFADNGNAIRRIGRRNMVGKLLQRSRWHQRG